MFTLLITPNYQLRIPARSLWLILSCVGSNMQASAMLSASTQSSTTTQALTASSPLSPLKSPSTEVVPAAPQANSPPPTEPLPSTLRPSLSRPSSDLSRQVRAPSSGSLTFSEPPTSVRGSTRRPEDVRTTSKDSMWPAMSGLKWSSPLAR